MIEESRFECKEDFQVRDLAMPRKESQSGGRYNLHLSLDQYKVSNACSSINYTCPSRDNLIHL